jgi:hypothetical protein
MGLALTRVTTAAIGAVGLTVFLTACDDGAADIGAGITSASAAQSANRSAPPPAPLMPVQAMTGEIVAWPFTGSDVNGTATDPVNLVFSGQADPRQVRAALLALDGDRSAFGMPNQFPFNCTWSDTPSGGIQATYSDSAGWQGSAIQLQCGDYAPVRFHLRLFRHLGVTLGGAHFEVLIPGTTDHQVLSWELAEQLVTADIARTGLLGAAPSPSGAFYPSPSWRSIPTVIWNGLPVELRFLATGNPAPSATDVPIPSDGNATMLFLAFPATVAPSMTNRTFTLTFDQVIPKPFCGGPMDYVYVTGPVTLTENAAVNASGDYTSDFQATGRLTVVPVNPLTGQPAGEPYSAQAHETHLSAINGRFQRASSHLLQIQLPVGRSGHGRLDVRLLVDSRGTATGDTKVQCTP